MFTTFVTVFVGIVANKLAMRIKWLDDPAIQVLQSALAKKEKRIQELKMECLAREVHGYAQCEKEILRTVSLSVWVFEQMKGREPGQGGELVKAIKNAL